MIVHIELLEEVRGEFNRFIFHACHRGMIERVPADEFFTDAFRLKVPPTRKEAFARWIIDRYAYWGYLIEE